MKRQVWIGLFLVVATEQPWAVSTMTEISPDELDKVPIPVEILAEDRHGEVSVRLIASLPEAVSSDRIQCFLSVSDGDDLVVWTAVEQWSRKSDKSIEYSMIIDWDLVKSSFLELRIFAPEKMPAFDGYRFRLAPFTNAIGVRVEEPED